jgi:hypothetical protein
MHPTTYMCVCARAQQRMRMYVHERVCICVYVLLQTHTDLTCACFALNMMCTHDREAACGEWHMIHMSNIRINTYVSINMHHISIREENDT